MQLFYTTDIEEGYARLPEEEARHCALVLRKKRGDQIHFIDGVGGFYFAEIIEADKKKCLLRIIQKEIDFGRRAFHLHLAVAPTKNMERFEWFLEKATEIGIDEITPMICAHSERRKLRLERSHKILLSAVKQSVRAYIPKLNEPSAFDKVIDKNNYAGVEQCFIATLEKADTKHLKAIAKPLMKTTILIGPEGGFSPEETERALQNNFVAAKLGQNRLRTETAGIVACHTLNLLNNL